MKTTRVKRFSNIPSNATGVFKDEKGNRFYMFNGKLHRLVGPAEERANGTKLWCLEGKFLTKKEHFKRTRWIRSKLGKLILEKEEK